MKKKQQKHEKGQALIIIVFGIVMLLALTALAVDGNNVWSDRRQAQNAADTAVLAAARAKVRGEDYGLAGFTIAGANGYTHDEVKTWVSIQYPPTSGKYAGNNEYIQVSISHIVDMYFAGVLGITELTNEVTAVARVSTPIWPPAVFGNAVVGLNKSDCKAVTYQGNADTTFLGGGLFVNSDCANSAFFNNSGAATLNAPSLCAVGGITAANGALNIPGGPQTGCQQVDPDAVYVKPNIQCAGNAVKTDDTYSPGTINGDLHLTGGNKDFVLQSGTYCIKGDLDVSANSLTGVNVLLYVEGDITFNGSSQIQLSGPESGDYKNLVIYSTGGDVKLNGSATSSMAGTILAPNADVSILGGGDSGIVGQVIGDTVDISGGSGTNIVYNAGGVWTPPTPPQIELVQ